MFTKAGRHRKPKQGYKQHHVKQIEAVGLIKQQYRD
jgi:hypothetical protein